MKYAKYMRPVRTGTTLGQMHLSGFAAAGSHANERRGPMCIYAHTYNERKLLAVGTAGRLRVDADLDCNYAPYSAAGQ